MDKNRIRKKIGLNLIELKDILSKAFPQNKKESIFFILIVLFYLPYSLFLSLSTLIMTGEKEKMTDYYFSFDNPVFFEVGSKIAESHPLLLYFAKPFIWIGNLLIYLVGIDAKIIFFTLLSVFLIALSCLYVYRYLKEIIGLSGYMLIVISLFYVVTFSNMILCFTTESYTVTAFLITFMTYIYASYAKQGRGLSFASNAFFVYSLGGVTSTNSILGIFSIVSEDIKNRYLWAKAAIILFIFSLLFLLRPNLLSGALSRYDKFSTLDYPGSLFQKIFSGLLGNPVLSPGFTWNDEIRCIFTAFYSSWIQYAYIFLILAIMIASLYLNRKNKSVLFLGSVFAYLLLLHVIISFGLDEGFIYGAHWVFIIPLLMGWLFAAITPKMKKYLASVFLVMLLCLLINNLYRLVEFVKLALEHFER